MASSSALARWTVAVAVGALLAIAVGPSSCLLTTDLDALQGGGGQSSSGTGGSHEGGTTASCTSVVDCPGSTNPCETVACIGGVCGLLAATPGTALPNSEQQPGDCLARVCDAHGAPGDLNDDADVPDDGTTCTADACISGTPSNTPATVGTECSDGSGTLCDGLGHCAECLYPGDCTSLPEDGACVTRACDDGSCTAVYAAQGDPVAAQFEGDCQQAVCDGAGAIIDVTDDTDVPDDGNDCTTETCVNGVPQTVNAPNNTLCGSAPGQTCVNGQCKGCANPSSCPGQDDFCQQRSCMNGTCGMIYQLAGTPLPGQSQTPHDCLEKQCNGQGGIQTVDDDADVPTDDGLSCTLDTCSGGNPSHPPAPANTACTEGGGSYCDGAGSCVECNAPGQCPAAPVCQAPACAQNQCGLDNLPPGTPASNQIPGDCQVVLCDGNGNTAVVSQDSDLPVDGNACTGDVCTNGVPSNPPSAAGAPCNDNGGKVCDGAGNCVPCVFDSHCQTGVEYCDLSLHECVPLKLPGAACGGGNECASGACADGVCCDTACTGVCRACTAAKKGSGSDGACGYIKSHTDPDNECAGNLVCDSGGCCDPLGSANAQGFNESPPIPACP